MPGAWDPSCLPDLTGKVYILTGGTAGIGAAAGEELVAHGAHVIVTGRNTKRGESYVQRLQSAYKGAKVEFKQADNASFKDLDRLVDDFLARGLPLHGLLNNAGAVAPPKPHTPEGLDLTYASDFFGALYLTQRLIDKLSASAPSRIVWMSSCTEYYGRIKWDDIGGFKNKTSKAWEYATAKLYNLMIMRALAKRLQPLGIDVFAVHPGMVQSTIATRQEGLFNKIGAFLFNVADLIYGQSPYRGAFSLLYAAADPHVIGRTGTYFGPWYRGVGPFLFFHNLWNTSVQIPQNPAARDPDQCDRLFEESARLLVATLPARGVKLEFVHPLLMSASKAAVQHKAVEE